MTAFTLPTHYRRALNAAAILVPASERDDWRRLWHAELWHATHERQLRSNRRPSRAFDLTLGLVFDAVWLRAEGLRLRFSGSPLLCLANLALLCIVAAAFSFRLSGVDTHQLFLANLGRHFPGRFLASVFIAIGVQFGLPREGRAPIAPVASWSLARLLRATQRAAFLTAKLTFIGALAFFLGIDLIQPFHTLDHMGFPQIYLTAILLTVGLRWVTLDQKCRCQHCLHSLTDPARIGRPSHNFLEWNGTERACRLGHGALHQPEMQTSWQDSNRWVIS